MSKSGNISTAAGALSERTLVREGIERLGDRLPPGWSIAPIGREVPEKLRGVLTIVDLLVEIRGPGKTRCVVAIEAKAEGDPRLAILMHKRRKELPHGIAALLLLCPYLSPSTRSQLKGLDIGYLDLTGNARLVLSKPGLFIETRGADENPYPQKRPVRSLRGALTGKLVRHLIDVRGPHGIRALATATKLSAGFVSRIADFLDSEAIIERSGRGAIDHVDWQRLLRRWAADAPFESRGRFIRGLEPRGLDHLLASLSYLSKANYAVSGSLAARCWAAAAQPRVAVVYSTDATLMAGTLKLSQGGEEANVFVVEPKGNYVFEGILKTSPAIASVPPVWCCAPSQVAADLLTAPDRGPAEAEELIRWMQANEGAWRV